MAAMRTAAVGATTLATPAVSAAASLAAVCVCACACAGGCAREAPPAGSSAPLPAEDAAALRAEASAMYDALAAVHHELPDPAALATGKCPDPDILAESPEARARTLTLVAARPLERLATGSAGKTPAGPFDDGCTDEFLGGLPTRAGLDAFADLRLLRKATARFAERHYLGVFVPVSEKEARVPPEGATFAGGHLAGWLVVVRRRDAKPLCQAPFVAESSAFVRAGEAPTEREAREGAVRADLDVQVRLWATGALARISDALRLPAPMDDVDDFLDRYGRTP